jgi:hypothetical protein
MNGFETYLAAALAKKQVPLVVVMDRSKADYIITSTLSQQAPTQPAVVVNNTNVNGNSNSGFPRAHTPANYGSTSASISVVDPRTSQIVFAYSVGKSRDTNQIQSAAEACAKHLKEFIEKPKK